MPEKLIRPQVRIDGVFYCELFRRGLIETSNEFSKIRPFRCGSCENETK